MFVLGKPFQPNLMFVGKAGAYLIEEPLKCPTARDKHSSLSLTSVNNRCKKFFNNQRLGPMSHFFTSVERNPFDAVDTSNTLFQILVEGVTISV